MKKIASALTICFALAASPAFAQKWTGVHVAIGGGAAIADGTTDVTTAGVGYDDPIYTGQPFSPIMLPLPDQVNFFDADATGSGDIDNTKAFASFEVGYDYRVNRDIVIGAFGSFDVGGSQSDTVIGRGGWQIVEAGGDIPLPGWRIGAEGDAAAIATVSTRHNATLAARVGYLVSPEVMIYGLGGYSATKATLSFALDVPELALANRYPVMRESAWRHGFVLGTGIEAKIDSRFSVKFEYRYADHGSYGFSSQEDFVVPATVAYPYRLEGDVMGGVQVDELKSNSLRMMISMRL